MEEVNRKTIIILSIALVFSVAISVFSLLKKGKAVPAVTLIIDGVSGKVVKKQLNEDSLFWNNYPIMVMQAENTELDTSIDTYDEKMNETSLKKLANGQSKLIFKFSMNFYQEEVDSTLMAISALKSNNIIVLTDADNIRYYKLMSSRNLELFNKIHFIEKTSMDFMISNRRLPLIFLLSPDNKMSHIFIPRKEIPMVTPKYLKYMINNFVH